MRWRVALAKDRAGGASLLPCVALGVAAACAIFAWTTPNHYAPWLSFHGEFAMAMAFVIGIAWLCWHTRREALVVPWLAAAFLMAAVVPVLQAVGGLLRYGGDAWLAALYLVSFSIAIVAGDRAARAFGIARATAPLHGTLVTGALVSAWIAWYQWFGHDYLAFMAINIERGARPYANLIQPNNLATLLVLGLLSTAFLLNKRAIGRITAAALVALLGLTIAATQSRAGLLEVAVACAALVMFRPREGSSGLQRIDVVLGCVLVVVLSIAWQSIVSQTEPGSGRGLEGMTSGGVRPLHWATMLDAVGRRPWFGWGWGQVSAAQFAVAVDHPATHETLGYAHNFVLDLLIWNGVPVGLALFAALGVWLCTAFRSEGGASGRLAWCAVVAVLLHALVEFPLYYAYFSLPTGYFIGAVSARSSPSARRELRSFALRVPRVLGVVAVIATSAVTIALAVEYLRFEEDVRRLRFFQNRVGTPVPPEPPRIAFLTQLEAFWSFALSPHRRGMTERELRDMRDVVHRFPSDGNMVRYAASLALNGSAAAATDVLRRVCRLNPESSCASMREVWREFGAHDPEIAAVAWPES